MNITESKVITDLNRQLWEYKSVFSSVISGSFILFRVFLLAAFQQNLQSSEKEKLACVKWFSV